MKWFIVLALAFLFPLGDTAAQQVSAAVLSGASLLSVDVSAPQPRPQAIYDDAAKDTWEMGLGFPLGAFRSSPFNSILGGLNSSLSYYFRNHLAVEGSITSAFDLQSSNDSDAKYVFYGAGVKLNWGNRKMQPFVHALLGGAHLFPQTAYGNNGFAVELGGGLEKRLSQRLWLRFEGDYLRSQLYAARQNNFQGVAGISYRF